MKKIGFYILLGLFGLGMLGLFIQPVSAQKIPKRHLGFFRQGRLLEKAKVLGMSQDELVSKLKSGKTFREIAAEKGISHDELQAKMLEAARKRMDQLVKDGYLTKEEAEARLNHMRERQKQMRGACKPGLRDGIMRFKR